ncbi:hypothetical protein MSAN_00918400 [Mycena sanguinolenta]|uniref:Peptidase C14 caspase domain-containing protein n=1 Tax=Mycena sanguinolenta TaxID=230812 RepID=A0A8H6YYH7_9AGAR|nr:hypothetical protein MSAN_00918400 [Mycena sanguinolenta]
MSRYLFPKLPWLNIPVFVNQLLQYIGWSPPPDQPLLVTGTEPTYYPFPLAFSLSLDEIFQGRPNLPALSLPVLHRCTSSISGPSVGNTLMPDLVFFRFLRPPLIKRPVRSSMFFFATLTSFDRDDPAFFALVIGINTYEHVRPLEGCVADADDMVDYLEKILGVPPAHITNLRNGQATRRAIKRSLASLASDDRIRSGDSIVIFFAGHGAQAKAPPGWAAGGHDARIEMILPVDFVSSTNDNEDWQGIPDITLAALLSKLAMVKGDNIVQTVIHDCCHSGSSTRDNDSSSKSDVETRGIELAETYKVLESIDSDVDGGHRVSFVSTGFQKTAMASHVLLAACSESMLAQESLVDNNQKRGHFTRTLLEFLRSPIVQGAAITYTELIERLPDLPGAQYPQCDGDNRGRIMFNGRASKKSKALYHVTADSESAIKLQAGEAQSITKNAIVSIFRSSDTAVPIGRLQVAKAGTCSSLLQRIPGDSSFHIPLSAWAMLAKAGDGTDASVEVSLKDSFLLLLKIVQEMEEQWPDKRNIIAVDPDPALNLPYELAFVTENGQAAFKIGDQECCKAGLTHIPHTVPFNNIDGLYMVLTSATDFFFHLRHSSNNTKNALAHHLKLEAYTLEEKDLDKDLNNFLDGPVLMPSSDNLSTEDGKLYAEASDEYDAIDTKYGFKLVSHSEHNLYVWAFMFDMSSLSIRCIYRPPSAKMKANTMHLNKHAGAAVAADASLLAHRELTIGYGSGGGRPQSFSLEVDNMVDVSYLKLFVTKQYVDLSYLEQVSPFDGLRTAWRISNDVAMASREVWDTVSLMIIQKRPTMT